MDITNFQRQHDDARAIVAEINTALATTAIDPHALSNMLVRLGGLLRIHFAMEDKSLYPALLDSHHYDAAQTARLYQHEMGGIWRDLQLFIERWRVSAIIEADSATFRAECVEILASLLERIDREDRLLYPLADIALSPTLR